ncbi:hypothetical protein Ahy_B01g056184 isoform B [Arachis hypogaea]|uniref:Transmembrane protein n=1 Tax=Arachis hypogaea TaxID=3818 RepID=A0A445AY91_ARAHY|nr:hypothetical protein Ahy_B01g056184 isoform B [Arachis hypogaea]
MLFVFVIIFGIVIVACGLAAMSLYMKTRSGWDLDDALEGLSLVLLMGDLIWDGLVGVLFFVLY